MRRRTGIWDRSSNGSSGRLLTGWMLVRVQPIPLLLHVRVVQWSVPWSLKPVMRVRFPSRIPTGADAGTRADPSLVYVIRRRASLPARVSQSMLVHGRGSYPRTGWFDSIDCDDSLLDAVPRVRRRLSRWSARRPVRLARTNAGFESLHRDCRKTYWLMTRSASRAHRLCVETGAAPV